MNLKLCYSGGLYLAFLNYEEKIIKNILNKIDENCFKNLYFHKDISSMLFEGLAYRGIVYLLKERIERDEKI